MTFYSYIFSRKLIAYLSGRFQELLNCTLSVQNDECIQKNVWISKKFDPRSNSASGAIKVTLKAITEINGSICNVILWQYRRRALCRWPLKLIMYSILLWMVCICVSDCLFHYYVSIESVSVQVHFLTVKNCHKLEHIKQRISHCRIYEINWKNANTCDSQHSVMSNVFICERNSSEYREKEVETFESTIRKTIIKCCLITLITVCHSNNIISLPIPCICIKSGTGY